MLAAASRESEARYGTGYWLLVIGYWLSGTEDEGRGTVNGAEGNEGPRARLRPSGFREEGGSCYLKLAP